MADRHGLLVADGLTALQVFTYLDSIADDQ